MQVHTLFTYSMKQSPSWEANRFSADQKIPRILWNPEGPSPRLQINPAHAPHPTPFHFLKILPSTPRISK